MSVRPLAPIGAVALSTILGACGGASSPSMPASQSVALPPFSQSAGGGTQQTLFIADQNKNVLLYTANINQQNPPLLGEITQGVTSSLDVCVGSNGTLYVVNSDGSTRSVAEYHRGSKSPFKIITNGLYTPGSCAADHAGNLYAVDDNAGIPVILVYAAGSSSPTRTIDLPDTSRARPQGLALNRNGALFVSMFNDESETATVYRIAHGSSTPKNLNLQDLPNGGALGIDKAGYLYAGGIDGNISIYPPRSTTPSRLITLNSAGFYSGLTVTPNGTIYWPNFDERAMYEFAPGASGPTNEFSTSFSGIDAAVEAW